MLSAYRVLDLTQEDGWLCGRILGDLGMDVIKIEPVGGDPGRCRSPFYHDAPNPEASLAWLAHNYNKRGITLSLDSPRGQDLFRELARRADFVIESFAPGYLSQRGIGYLELHALKPQLVMTSITPFGQTGPYANYRGSDLIAMGMSGFMSLVGEPGKPPLRVTLPQAPMWTGMYAAAGTLIAHLYRRRTGRGQQVDVSMQASLLWALANAPAFWSINRENLQRAGAQVVGRSVKGAQMRAIYRCRDGHINFILYGGEAGKHSNKAMADWMAEEGMAPEWLKHKDWDAFNVATSTQEEIDAIEAPFAEFLLRRTKAEFATEAVKRGIIGYPVNHALDILQDSQLQARQFWQSVPHPDLSETFVYPGVFNSSTNNGRAPRRAPHVGENNEEIYLGELGLSKSELEQLKQHRII